MLSDYTRLISGSDLRGVSLGPGVTLDREAARRAAAAFVRLLQGEGLGTAPRVAVGCDPRLSGPELMQGVFEGLCASGASCLDLGLCTTPAMFMATLRPDVDAAVMVTASHLPGNRNGLKFITRQGGLEAAQIAALAADMDRAVEVPSELQVQPLDFLPEYAAGLVDYIRRATGRQRPLEGQRIVVDAGNGSGGFFAGLVLEPLGAQTAGSVNLEPDGRFPSHVPNPEEPEAMAYAAEAVLRAKADLGIVFDADCDRAALVDDRGGAINRNRLIALLAAAQAARGPLGTVVTDSVTSLGLTRFIRSLGGEQLRFRRGYKNVIDKAKELNAAGVDCPLAVETSGHCAFRDNHFLDDGAYMVCRVLASLNGAKPMELIAGLEEPAEEAELRFALGEEDFRAQGRRAIDALRQAIDRRRDWSPSEDYEGVRALVALPGGSQGYILARLSVHDPVLPVNLEAYEPGGLRLLAAQLEQVLAGVGGLDLAPLNALARKEG